MTDATPVPAPVKVKKEEDIVLHAPPARPHRAHMDVGNDKTPVKAEVKEELTPAVATRAPLEGQSSPTGGTQIATPPDLLAFRTRKAGHEKVDKARVEAIVKRLTENSAYHKRVKQKWKDRNGRTRVLKHRAKLLRGSPEKVRRSRYMVDNNIIPELEFRRLRGRITVCCDFDCFYAQVEALDDPSLIGVPHAVTMGTGTHCTLATTSYEARALGVKGGMAAFIGKEICKELILKPVRMGRYAEISKMMEEVLVKFDPEYTMGSLDEAFLDITHLVSDKRSAADVVSDLRADVRKRTGLTISAGCAPSLMIAKIAADMNKPDGQTIVLPEKDMDEREFCKNFMGALPLIKVPGIGPATESTLENGLGYKTVSDIYDDRAIVNGLFTPFKIRFLLRIALGISCPWTDQYYDTGFIRKGIGSNRTFDRVSSEEGIMKRCEEIANYLEKEVEYAGAVGGQTFTVKMKNSAFQSFRKSITLPAGAMLCTADDFMLFAKKIILDQLPMEIRRIGMKLHKITWKKRPKGSIKQYLKVDGGEGEEEELLEAVENSKTTTQIQQARERAKRYFYEQFIVGDTNTTVNFKDTSCDACAGNVKGIKIEHMYEHSCLICNSRCFKYLHALNEHLDKCGQAKVEVKEEKSKITSFFKRSKEFGTTKRGVKRELESIGQPPKRARTMDVGKVKDDPDLPFLCPICNRCRFKDNSKLNSHVDECLNAKFLKSSGNVKAEEEMFVPPPVQVKEEATEVTPKVEERVADFREGVKSEPTTTGLGFTCPICNKCEFADNDTLNTHIDMCLNETSDVFKEALSTSR